MSEHMVDAGPENGTGVTDLSTSVVPPLVVQSSGPGKMHRALRGRYIWAVLLGLIGACAGGFAGYKSVTPAYKSAGLIEISPYLPRIIFETEETQLMPMFDQFVVSQMELLKSARVMDLAMEDEKWQEVGRGKSPKARQRFRQSTEVSRQRRSNLVQVSFGDEDPEVASIAVNAIIESYMKIFGERDARNYQKRLRVLEVRRMDLLDEINSISKRVKGLADEYGSDSLDTMYQSELQELQRLKHALRTSELDAVLAGASLVANQDQKDPEAAEQQWKDMSAQEIALIDNRMFKLLEEKRALEADLAVKRLQFVDRHPKIRALLKLQSVNKKTIESYAAQFRKSGPGLANDPDNSTAASSQAQARQLASLYGKAKEETLRLGRRHLTISSLREEQMSVRDRLQQTKERIEQLDVESAGSGRIKKISKAAASPLPINNGKRKQVAVLGFIGGGCVGVGVIMLIGYKDKRLRDSVDAECGIGRAPILGLLPFLPEDLGDAENATNACYAVHHIRTLLQLDPQGAGTQVFAVTGPVPGTGKTSLTLALGLSFASSGQKTLLIDSDIGGGALTHRLQAIIRRKLGQILWKDGLITEKQLQSALQSSQRESKPLGLTLVEMEILSEDDLAEALNRQEMMSIGLLDALNGESLTACTAETGIANLSIIPIGGAQAGDIGRISPQGIRRVIDGARKEFDNILIDTGPVPAAIVSGMVASAADQTVVVVSRGDQRESVERAITFLESIGARLAGVVFNRAAAHDIAHSRHCSAAAWNRRSIRPDNDGTGDVQASGQSNLARTRRLDPVTRAVAATSTLKVNDNAGAQGRTS